MDYLKQEGMKQAITNKIQQKVGYAFSAIVLLCILFVSGIAQAAPASTSVTYYHNDLLGSPVAATDDNGDLVWRKSYKPYGEEIEVTADSEQEFVGYTGHRLDKETGLVYAGARYYGPAIGRFMGIDPAGAREHIESNQQMFNRYAYGNNNPYRYVDPDGEFAVTAVVLGLVFLELALSVGHENAPGDDSIQPAFEGAGIGAVGGIAKGLNAVKGLGKAAKGGDDFFKGAKFTDKVKRQMRQDDFHSFPRSVEGFQDAGKVTKFKGGDGVTREKLEISGGFEGKEGKFEFIKEPDGTINHRFFRPDEQ